MKLPTNQLQWLESFAVGEVRYIPTSPDVYKKMQKSLHTRISELKGKRYTVVLGTVVLSEPVGAVAHVVCCTRVE